MTPSQHIESRFTLDTSGDVTFPAIIERSGDPDTIALDWRWSDLSPFAQGYVGSLFADVRFDPPEGLLGFSDLAPETLAALLKDCEAAQDYRSIPFGRWFNPNAAGGRCFWADRQDGCFPGRWEPLTLFIGDDGKVRFREAASPSEADVKGPGKP